MTKSNKHTKENKHITRELVLKIVIPLNSEDPDFSEPYREISLDQLNQEFKALNNRHATASWEIITS